MAVVAALSSAREPLGWFLMIAGVGLYGWHQDVVALGALLVAGAAVLDVPLSLPWPKA
ncbi:hypothetical protein [Kineococcus sp. SYSU DK004]|uniref:hypothetical protein n=1 Tax=Kineococcus sp. SYSU DK004 TaxID=3383125 RepID=UPI003D7C3E19